jgi:predicted transcriptional regulator
VIHPLKKYILLNEIPIKDFAKTLDVSKGTLYNILEQGLDMRLSLAMRIEKLTFGKVTCEDLMKGVRHRDNHKD